MSTSISCHIPTKSATRVPPLADLARLMTVKPPGGAQFRPCERLGTSELFCPHGFDDHAKPGRSGAVVGGNMW